MCCLHPLDAFGAGRGCGLGAAFAWGVRRKRSATAVYKLGLGLIDDGAGSADESAGTRAEPTRLGDWPIGYALPVNRQDGLATSPSPSCLESPRADKVGTRLGYIGLRALKRHERLEQSTKASLSTSRQ